MGFYLLDDAHNKDTLFVDEHEALRVSAVKLRRRAEDLIEHELEYAPDYPDGLYVRRPYPWLESFAKRYDDVLVQTNKVLGSLCEVRRNAFGNVGSHAGSEVWGVFAKEDIKADTVVVVDHTRTWVWSTYSGVRTSAANRTKKGCNGPGINGSRDNLNGGLGCMDEIHPNADDDNTVHDLRWVRDRCGVHAADVVLFCRALLCTIIDGASHPLLHPSLARLTPAYRQKPSAFQLDQDIVVPNEALRRFGIDIFANFSYDTDVLFTMLARIDNNSWCDPSVSSLHDLFAMFNHSCEPNCSWVTQANHATMQVQTMNEVAKGEQLFVHYDTYVQDQPLAKRRKRLRRWLAGDCQCTKCMREEELYNSDGSVKMDMSWDTDVKVKLPEDEVLERFKTESVDG
jgi:hypothetical protein